MVVWDPQTDHMFFFLLDDWLSVENQKMGTVEKEVLASCRLMYFTFPVNNLIICCYFWLMVVFSIFLYGLVLKMIFRGFARVLPTTQVLRRFLSSEGS